MKKRYRIALITSAALLIAAAAALFLSFYLAQREEGPPAYYLAGSKEQKEELTKLFSILEEKNEFESRFVINQRIIALLSQAGYEARLNTLLTAYAEKNPEDPYNAYYLFYTAENYRKSGASSFAVHYYERILKNYQDLLVEGQSLHYLCLRHLVYLVDEPAIKINYYKELLARFSDKNPTYPELETVEKGPLYYNMAKIYESLGEWELAIQAYKSFLQYPDSIIQEDPDAHAQVAEMIAFHDYRDKGWIQEDLETLTKRVQWALYRRDSRALNSYRSKVSFFVKSWEQDESMVTDEAFYSDFSRFMTPRLRYAWDLDPISNDQEAYLRTWGWSYYRIRTWYLYFRRIDFPADPDINGKWEWAGIYLGDKPFAKSE